MSDHSSDNKRRREASPPPSSNQKRRLASDCCSDALSSASPSVAIDEKHEDFERLTTDRKNMLHYMLKTESRYVRTKNTVTMHATLDFPLRQAAINYAFQIHRRLQLMPDVLFLGVNLFDRFLASKTCHPHELPLVMAASIWIAAHFLQHEDTEHTNEDINFYCHRDAIVPLLPGCTKRHLLDMKREILLALDYRLHCPTVLDFIAVLGEARDQDEDAEALTMFIIQITLYNYDFISIRPSAIALASFYLAERICGNIKACALFLTDEAKEVVNVLEHFMEHHFVYAGECLPGYLVDKFSHPDYRRVAVLARHYYKRRCREFNRCISIVPLPRWAVRSSKALGMEERVAKPEPQEVGGGHERT
ncbi:cyclin-like protein [Heliocybe sulcata]|uniref:Cyclin-like protein n=1 Tax=Heliocybe sulcata TaxID=5364 RepID=A0A5C3N2N1_9AGAM|nr:cyclin-like protein [Heliocybe sulcata]